MTDNEVIKALGLCGNQAACSNCPLGDLGGIDKCIHTLMLNALDLINRQKAEIEHQQFKIYNLEQANKELAIQLESMRISVNSYKYLYEKMQKENQNEIM